MLYFVSELQVYNYIMWCDMWQEEGKEYGEVLYFVTKGGKWVKNLKKKKCDIIYRQLLNCEITKTQSYEKCIKK